MLGVVNRREADSAVAHDRGGDAMLGGGQHVTVPGGLPLVVGVDVDEAGRDDRTLGVDRPVGGSVARSDLDDATFRDRDVSAETGRTVNDPAADDLEIPAHRIASRIKVPLIGRLDHQVQGPRLKSDARPPIPP